MCFKKKQLLPLKDCERALFAGWFSVSSRKGFPKKGFSNQKRSQHTFPRLLAEFSNQKRVASAMPVLCSMCHFTGSIWDPRSQKEERAMNRPISLVGGGMGLAVCLRFLLGWVDFLSAGGKALRFRESARASWSQRQLAALPAGSFNGPCFAMVWPSQARQRRAELKLLAFACRRL